MVIFGHRSDMTQFEGFLEALKRNPFKENSVARNHGQAAQNVYHEAFYSSF
jgi:hypothetical protein